MRLHSVASRFDKALCADAYSSSSTFYAQLDLFDDSKRDGLTVTRRVLSAAPAVTIPARRAIELDGEYWIVGDGHEDTFLGAPIRVRYVIQHAQGLLKYQTPVQALSTGGTDAYGGRVWIKDMKEIEVSSGAYSFYTIFFAPDETVQVGDIVTAGGRMHRAKNVYRSAAGLLAVEANELAAGAVATARNYYARTLNPLTDVMTDGTPVSVNILRMRFQDDYLYPNESAPKYEEGDIKVLITKAAVAAPKPEHQLALADGRWRVLSVEDEGSCWGLHMRHA